jgi:hypothetical protein
MNLTSRDLGAGNAEASGCGVQNSLRDTPSQNRTQECHAQLRLSVSIGCVVIRAPQPLPSGISQARPLRQSGTRKSTETDRLRVPEGLSNGLRGRRCEGLDPRQIDPAVLTKAGHPPMRTSALVSAYNRIVGGEVFSPAFARIKRHKHIRAFCLECLDGNAAEVRRCTTFWCPFWPYRMGSNPHNPRRGVNPFAKEPPGREPGGPNDARPITSHHANQAQVLRRR